MKKHAHMEQKEEKQIVKTEEKPPLPIEKKGINIKIFLFGMPLFIAQLIAVYFITANILVKRIQVNNSSATQNPVEKNIAAQQEAKQNNSGKFVYMVDDLIVNPANTDGKKLLLSSIGFDVASDHDQKELKAKDVILKDAVISVLTSKDLEKLANIAYRDTLRTEIIKRLNGVMPDVKINTIYFSKYILQ